jgi:DNA (cytosine-5)-methyltransferase 1
MRRVIEECQPDWILAENVPGIIGMELDRVLADLESLHYSCGTLVVPACAVDARHRRNRIWIIAVQTLAHAPKQQTRRLQWSERNEEKRPKPIGSSEALAHADIPRSQGHRGLRECSRELPAGPCCWPDEAEWFAQSGMGRVAHGIPHRMDRLKALGNAIVPQVAAQLIRMMIAVT